MDLSKEPDVVINGVELNRSQAMALRVVISSYHMKSNELGDGEHGEIMIKRYGGSIKEISEIIFKTGG